MSSPTLSLHRVQVTDPDLSPYQRMQRAREIESEQRVRIMLTSDDELGPVVASIVLFAAEYRDRAHVEQKRLEGEGKDPLRSVNYRAHRDYADVAREAVQRALVAAGFTIPPEAPAVANLLIGSRSKVGA